MLEKHKYRIHPSQKPALTPLFCKAPHAIVEPLPGVIGAAIAPGVSRLFQGFHDQTQGVMMSRLLLVLMVSALAVPAYGTDGGSTSPGPDSGGVRKEAEKTVGIAGKVREERDEFIAKARSELDDLKAKVAELRTKAQEAGRQGKADLDKQVKNLEREQRLAERKLAKLKSATSEKWSELKDGVSRAIDQLKQSVRKTMESSREGS